MTDPQSIGLWITATEIHTALVDQNGYFSASHSIPIVTTAGVSGILDSVIMSLKDAQKTAQEQQITLQGVGVSVMAHINNHEGTLTQVPHSLSSLVDFPLRQALEDALQLPVALSNAVHAMARYESRLGIGQDKPNFFYVLVDDDVDGALWHEGQLWRGARGGAGDIGYLVADWLGEKPITVAQRASSSGIIAQYSMRSRKFDKPNINDLMAYAQHDDQLAMRVLRDGGRIVGAILSPIVAVFEPQAVIVGGRFAHNTFWWSAFEMAFRQSNTPNSARLPIFPAKWHEKAPLIGAGLMVLEPQ